MKNTLSKQLNDCLAASKSGSVDPTVFPSQVSTQSELIFAQKDCIDFKSRYVKPHVKFDIKFRPIMKSRTPDNQ